MMVSEKDYNKLSREVYSVDNKKVQHPIVFGDIVGNNELLLLNHL